MSKLSNPLERAGATGVAKMPCAMTRENFENSACVIAGLNAMSCAAIGSAIRKAAR
jgi:hypothetical protein